MNVTYLAAVYRVRTNSFAVYEFPEGEAFNFELQDHIFMANDKVMSLGGGFMPLGYGSIGHSTQKEKEKAFEDFYQMALAKLPTIPACDVQQFEPPNDDWV